MIVVLEIKDNLEATCKGYSNNGNLIKKTIRLISEIEARKIGKLLDEIFKGVESEV